ncbi:hypothetical protein FRC10_003030 [Ceratobasidium sp. 414]|nr:hypothetical protein FRC10_003030 [Ceratobasidium sp. 414]
METSSAAAPPVSGTPASTGISSSPLPQTTQIIPGTTVVGTGSTGDVWSYTIPGATSVFPISASAAAAPNPPANTLVFTTVVISGTTVTGGMETGVPWSYTIPPATFLSSVIVPVTLAPTQSSVFSGTPTPTSAPISNSQTPSPSPPGSVTPSPSDLTSSPTASSLSSPSPSSASPPAAASPQKDTAALSGGIVAVILGALLLVILGIAAFLCLRVRRRRKEWDKPDEKGVGVVWGMGWGREEKARRGWRKARPGMTRGDGGGESSGLGSRTRLNPGEHMEEGRPANERSRSGGKQMFGLSGEIFSHMTGLGRPRIKYPYPAPTPDLPVSHPNSHMHVTSPNNTYPSSSRYPQAHLDPNTRPSQGTKPPRSIPPPSPHVYAPPPPPPPLPEPQPAPVPDLYQSVPPPHIYQSSLMSRSTSPHGSGATSPVPRGPGPNRLSKQRVTPSASALLRHMVPARGVSLRRSGAVPPPPPSSSGQSEQPTRPGMDTLPSFIRERQFSPSRSGVTSSSQSALFSPQTSHSHQPLPLPHNRSFATSRDGHLSPPPPTFPRDRYSQTTSTTRSGGSGGTGRSRDSRYTRRSMGSGVTRRSGDSRLTGRSGGLGQIVEERRGWEGHERGK